MKTRIGLAIYGATRGRGIVHALYKNVGRTGAAAKQVTLVQILSCLGGRHGFPARMKRAAGLI